MKTKLMIAAAALTAVLGVGCSTGSNSETTETTVPSENVIEVENRNPVVRLDTEPRVLIVTCNAGLMTISTTDRRAGVSTEIVADCEQALAALRTGDDTIEPGRADQPQS